MGSTAFIPSVFLHQGACLIRQEGLPFSDPGPPTAVHRNAHLNSNGGELHWPPSPPFSFPRLSRFILRLINRTQLLTGSFLQNRGVFSLTSFSRERARRGFFSPLPLKKLPLKRRRINRISTPRACVPLGHLHPIGKVVFFSQKAKRKILLPLRPQTSTFR